MSNKFKYIALVLIGWAPSLFGSDDFARAVFGITKEADDLVLDALRDSVTLWRGSSDWQDKILSSSAKEDTAVGNYQFDNFWNGRGNFGMRRQGNKLRVESIIEAEAAFKHKDGFKVNNNGIVDTIYSGKKEYTQVDLYTKCKHTLHIGEKPADKIDRVVKVLMNRSDCSNVYCQNPECRRLRENAFYYDVAKVVREILKDDAPKVRRVSECVSVFPMDVLREVLKK